MRNRGLSDPRGPRCSPWLTRCPTVVLLDVTFDDNGDIDRESFLVEVQGGKAVVKEILPPLGKK
jgi:hypothetical protein